MAERRELILANMGKRITKKIDVRMPEACRGDDLFDFGDEDADQLEDQSEHRIRF
jgi:hypothetical protein